MYAEMSLSFESDYSRLLGCLESGILVTLFETMFL